jgi:hypothetical protein
MRRANPSKHLKGLFIFICVICLFPVFSLAAEAATLADLAGTWNSNAFATGPDAPWWERMTITAAADGTFTFSGTESNGNVDSGSGTFWIGPGGILMTLPSGDSDIDPPLCQMNSRNTVLVCTETRSDSSANLIVLTKQAASYKLANLAGTWEGHYLVAGPTFGWDRVTWRVKSNGRYTGSVTRSDGSSGSVSGTLSISSDGVITCVAGSCMDPNFESFMDAGKSVMVGTSAADPTGQDVVLRVLTREAASYSMGNLAGTWQMNGLASGPGTPRWESTTITISRKGQFFSVSWEDGGVIDTAFGTCSISPGGVINLVTEVESGKESRTVVTGVMDATKTVFVGTSTWTGNNDPGTADLFISTKSASTPAR